MIFALTDARIEINGVNLSPVFNKVSLQTTVDITDVTPLGALWRVVKGKLVDWQISLTGFQDYGSGAADNNLYSILGNTVMCKLRPTSAAISANNPEYAGSALITEYTPSDAPIGDLAAIAVSVKGTTPLVRSIS